MRRLSFCLLLAVASGAAAADKSSRAEFRACLERMPVIHGEERLEGRAYEVIANVNVEQRGRSRKTPLELLKHRACKKNADAVLVRWIGDNTRYVNVRGNRSDTGRSITRRILEVNPAAKGALIRWIDERPPDG